MRVELVPHDPAWSLAYDAEARRIEQALGPVLVRAHHIGSTSIPVIPAKPIIDILLEVESLVGLDAVSTSLEALGYEARGESGIPGRRFYWKDASTGVGTHHVHAFEVGTSNVERHLAFRDYLRANPVEAAAYGDLKRRLAVLHADDREAYQEGKAEYIRSIDNAARLVRFIESVWNTGDVTALDDFIADRYTIHSDPGDPWDGRTLTRGEFRERLLVSRVPFPDLRFELAEVLGNGDRVAISWTMRGTQTGPLLARPASGRSIAVQGMTIYYFAGGKMTGHRQVVDRLAVAQQLGLT